MVSHQAIKIAILELERARKQYAKLVEMSGVVGENLTDQEIRDSVYLLFRHFLDDGKPNELRELFAIRQQCDLAMAITLRNQFRGMAFEAKTARRDLDKTVDRMEKLCRQKNPSVEEFLRLDFDFHAAIANLAGQSRMSMLIRELGKHQLIGFLKGKFPPGLMLQTILEHKRIIEAIFDAGDDDSLLEQRVSDHVLGGKFQQTILFESSVNASKRASAELSLNEQLELLSKGASMTLLTDELLLEYKERVETAMEGNELSDETWRDLVKELKTLEAEVGAAIAVHHFDAVVDRTILQLAHGEDKYLLHTWIRSKDEKGRDRLRSQFVATCESYSEVVKYRLEQPADVACKIVVERPRIVGYSLSHS